MDILSMAVMQAMNSAPAHVGRAPSYSPWQPRFAPSRRRVPLGHWPHLVFSF